MKLKVSWVIFVVILVVSCRKDKNPKKSAFYSIESSGPFIHTYPSKDPNFPYNHQPRDSGSYTLSFSEYSGYYIGSGLQSLDSATTTVYIRISLYCENVMLAEEIKNEAGQPSVWISAVLP